MHICRVDPKTNWLKPNGLHHVFFIFNINKIQFFYVFFFHFHLNILLRAASTVTIKWTVNTRSYTPQIAVMSSTIVHLRQDINVNFL